MNFLEHLAAEWYELNGCLVRTNVQFGKLKTGGYEGEMDVVAYDPKSKSLIHIETSDDAYSWDVRRERFKKKFANASKYYQEFFPLEIKEIKRVAIVAYVQRTMHDLGKDIELVLVPHFIRYITEQMKEYAIVGRAIPESYPLLRAFQHAYWYGICKQGLKTK